MSTIRIYSSVVQLVFNKLNIVNEFVWNGENQNAIELSTGIYFITLLYENDKGKLKVLETKHVLLVDKID